MLFAAGAAAGVWEGWGTSLAWWGNVFGDRDDFADIFFTTRSVAYNGTTLPGLGLNIARYNLGASSWNSANGVVPRWSTVPAGSDRYTQRQDIRLSGKTVSVPFVAASVQTLQVDGVSA